MENGGIIKAELYPDTAPVTVENFVSLIEDNFFDGLIFKNPIFVQLLGMCSTLAVSTSVINGLGMGVSVTAVLILNTSERRAASSGHVIHYAEFRHKNNNRRVSA